MCLRKKIYEMRSLRTRLAASLRASIESHLALIESLEQDPEEKDPLVESAVEHIARATAEERPG